ncbi:MAG: choice-of-anchor Q domain-containing protein [Anaerolineae bacterium]
MSEQKRTLALFGVLMALALLFIATLFSGPGFVSPVHAVLGTRYVDGATGSDASDCSNPAAPCATIGYALSQAGNGDEIWVAQGTYTENLTVNLPVTLEGGYSGPPAWNRDVAAYETIILNDQATTPGDWDGRQVAKPAVISDGAELKMWYDGRNLDEQVAVGLATSTDGLTWTKSVSNPVLVGDPGEWDGGSGEHGSYVIKDGIYKMWYEGSADYGVRQTGYATSTDGIEWNKYPGNPVIQAGPEGYDQETAGHGSVLHEAGTYKRWYHAAGDQGAIIAYATAPDEVTWTKQGPVLLPEPGQWDESALWGPSVLNLDGTYWMWYSAAGPMGPPAIGVVTSTDGISWTRFLTGPVVFEDGPIGDPMVISDSGKLKMWYSRYDWGTVNYAESEDGIHWTLYPANPVLEPGNLANWGGRPVTLDYGSDGVVLDGFTITGGDAFAGGGLLVANGGSALVANCRITGNQSNAWAGGAWFTDVDATLRDSTISYNSSGGSAGIEVNHDFGLTHLDLVSCKVEHNMGGQVGGMSVWGDQASATVVDAVFFANSAENGGGIGLWNSASAIISNTSILSNTSYNEGAGISLRESSSANIYGTQVLANTAQGGQGGGISSDSGDVHLASSWVVGNVAWNNEGGGIAVGEGGSFHGENCIVAGNHSGTHGGGLWFIHDGPFQLINCDLVGNDAANEGGALATSFGTQIGMTNTLIISNGGNTALADRDGSGSALSLDYCDTYGNAPDGTNGITIVRTNCLGTPPEDGVDPLFVGGAWPGGTGPAYAAAWLAYDYHLQAGSPAIDTGTSNGAPNHDIEGTPRDAAPDMGAYEWTAFRIFLPLVVRDQ